MLCRTQSCHTWELHARTGKRITDSRGQTACKRKPRACADKRYAAGQVPPSAAGMDWPRKRRLQFAAPHCVSGYALPTAGRTSGKLRVAPATDFRGKSMSPGGDLANCNFARRPGRFVCRAVGRQQTRARPDGEKCGSAPRAGEMRWPAAKERLRLRPANALKRRRQVEDHGPQTFAGGFAARSAENDAFVLRTRSGHFRKTALQYFSGGTDVF